MRCDGTTGAGALDSAHSREATDRLLSGLRDQGWRPHAWLEFFALAARRSVYQAWAHPVALVEVTGLHVAISRLIHRREKAWVMTSWALTASHLGLLDDKRTLGLANTITILRANLPALATRLGPWTPFLSLVSDFIDGRVARHTRSATLFGKHADFLADTAFWTWFTIHNEPSRRIQGMTFAAWLGPTVGVAAASFARGGMIDLPRFRWLRPCAAAEILIGVRAVQRLLTRSARP